VAQVVHEAFDYLDAPPERICLPEYPVPYSPPLEDGVIPSAERIAATVRSLLKD
jgi:pyruvate/2-oxoglutarate/acetoin dehydrogenase E1 component